MPLFRSYLFVPGNNPSRMQKALNSGADAVIFDLEDAVAPNEKEEARRTVIKSLEKVRQGKVFVRINSWQTGGEKDFLELLQSNNLYGIMLPKAEEKSVVEEIAIKLSPGMEFIPLVETARGVVNAKEIAAVKGVTRFAFGALDFTLDIGTSYSKKGTEISYARSHLVVISRACGIDPPVDTVYPDLEDMQGLCADVTLGKQLGMYGKLIIHPKQISPVHQTLTPTTAEIEEAQKIVNAFEKASNQGVAAIQVEGKFVDLPVVNRAKKILEIIKN